MPRLAIIGLGLIGGSLGLALKRAQLEGLEVVGFDHEWGGGSPARQPRAPHPPGGAAGAAAVALAVPITRVRAVFEEIAPALGEGAVVTDTASTKRDVMRWAQELLPEAVSFVGGHPIAGKEQAGLDATDATLFQGRPWAITPSVDATEQAVKTIEDLIAVVGAQP